MMPRLTPILLVALVLLPLSGCLPQELIVWSPDGQQAAVITGGELRFTDADGKLTEPLAEKIAGIRWLPDSTRFVAAREVEIADWTEAKSLLSETQQVEAKTQAEQFYKELLAYQGDLKDFAPKSSVSSAGFVYLRENYRDELVARVGRERFDSMLTMGGSVWQLQLMTFANGSLTLGQVLDTELEAMIGLCVSPNGKLLAYMAPLPTEDGSTPGLFIKSLDGDTPPRLVAEGASGPEFTIDGQQLLYVRGIGPWNTESHPTLGELTRCDLYDEAGALGQTFDGQAMTVMLFDPLCRIRCLSDGRILFSATEVNLPALSGQVPSHSGLYMLLPGEDPKLHCLLTPKERQGAMPATDVFQVSPDETRVAIIYDNGTVGLLPLDGGPMHMVQTDGYKDPSMAPYWRSQVELCMLVPAGSAHGSPNRQEIVLWSPTEVRCISRDWPAMGLLKVTEQSVPPQPATQPTTRPAAPTTMPTTAPATTQPAK